MRILQGNNAEGGGYVSRPDRRPVAAQLPEPVVGSHIGSIGVDSR